MFLDFNAVIPELNIFQVFGVMGFLIYILVFLAQQMGHICGNGIMYPATKIVAASMVLTSLTDAFNLASALIQSSYIFIGMIGLVLRGFKSKKLQSLRPIEPDAIRT